MPPKPASAAATRRSDRIFPTPARKPIPNSIPTTPINSSSPSSATAVTPPPPTASPKTRPIHTPIAQNTLQKPPHTTAPSRAQPNSPQKTLISKIDGNKIEKSGKSIDPENPVIEQFRADNIGIVSNLGSHQESEGSVKPETGPDSGKKKKKKIVKKVVKVVKVIKRKVPKRALIDDSENQGLMVKAEEESEVTKSSSFYNNDTEKPNSADEVIDDKPSIAHGANDTPNIVDDFIASLDIVIDDVIDDCNLANDEPTVAKENFIDEQNLELVSSAVESKRILSEKGEDESEIDSREQIVPGKIKSNDVIACVPDSAEIEKVDYMVTNESTSGEKPESGSVKGESDCTKLNKGVILSGELDAIERKRRRKTEIFVGGLSSNAKEDDIRKVFEEVGVVLEIRVVMSGGSTARNRGFAFVRFATADDAKNALSKCSNVKICGKQCNLALTGGNDTIYLGNLDKSWKTEHVESLLEKAGIEKIDKVTLKSDQANVGKNRGFGFIEFETSKDAQVALNKLQKRDAFGKIPTVKVAWAQPITELDEDKILKVKSVYAEYVPSSWNKEKVKEYFKRFGEIENVVLAKDLPSSKRKDFAFIDYANRDDALKCIEVVSKERSDDQDHNSKVKIAASLANANPKIKPMKHTPDRTSNQLPKAKPETIRTKPMKRTPNQTSQQLPKAKPETKRTSIKLHESRREWKLASCSYNEVKIDTNRPSTSTTDELVQILRQQAANKPIPPHPHLHPNTGTNAPDIHFPFPGSKRPFSQLGYDPHYVEPRGLPRTRIESSYPISGPSSSSRGVNVLPFSYNPQQRPAFTSEPVIGRTSYLSHFQGREQAPYYKGSNIYHKY